MQHQALLMYGAAAPAGTADTWDPLRIDSTATLSNANKTLTTGTGAFSSWNMGLSIKDSSAVKAYLEYLITTDGGNNRTGFAQGMQSPLGADLNGYALINTNDGQTYSNGGTDTAGSAYSDGDVLGIAVDFTSGGSSGTVQFYKNNATNGSITGMPVPLFVTLGEYDVSFTNHVLTMRTISSDFTYSPPSGYTPWGEIADHSFLHRGTFVSSGSIAGPIYGYISGSMGSYTNQSGATLYGFAYSASLNQTQVTFTTGGPNISSGANITIYANNISSTLTWNSGGNRYDVTGDPFNLSSTGTKDWQVLVSL